MSVRLWPWSSAYMRLWVHSCVLIHAHMYAYVHQQAWASFLSINNDIATGGRSAKDPWTTFCSPSPSYRCRKRPGCQTTFRVRQEVVDCEGLWGRQKCKDGLWRRRLLKKREVVKGQGRVWKGGKKGEEWMKMRKRMGRWGRIRVGKIRGGW